MTIIQLNTAFKKFNKQYFNDELPNVEIKYCKSKSYMGLFCFRRDGSKDPMIKINTYYDVPDKSIEETLIHEMIHLWQYINKKFDVHGYSFCKKMHEINAKGIHNIDIMDRSKDLKISKNVIDRLKPVYVLEWNDKFGLTQIAKIRTESNLKIVHDFVKRHYNINHINVYVTKHPSLLKLKSCNKVLHAYHVENDVWNDIFKTCTSVAI